ncbi:MAG: succinate dehydrogenase, hydrophobic membrane anchor protein, partial [Gammaproteobacteria bacterium]
MVVVRSATSFSRSGVSDWLIQRFSAVILAAYFLCIMGSLLLTPEMNFQQWQAMFDSTLMRVFSIVTLLALCAHAWIGIWTVLTDYLTSRHLGSGGTVLRIIVQAICALLTLVYLLWGLQIFWSLA